MTENQQPVRKPGPRQYLGGFGAMAMGFGIYSWIKGSDVPWGAQQTYGAILFGVGLVMVLISWLWPSKKSD